MDTRLDRLQQAALPLEIDGEAFNRLTAHGLQLARAYHDALPNKPVRSTPPEEQAKAPTNNLFTEQAQPPSEVFAEVEQRVCETGIRFGSSRMLAFIPGSGLYASALGDYLAAVTNRYVGASYAAPEAVQMEQELIQWLAKEMGYPSAAAGDLTAGGSAANLTALVAAREAHQIEPEMIRKTVVYCTTLAHHCVDKALRISGMRHAVLRRIAMDARYRLSIADLERQLRDDRQQGLRPWLVVGNAGSTDVGSVDPLMDIARIAEQYGLWFHADGAYGAAFALCEPGRRVLSGIECSDSLIIDPHKGLFTPFGSGAVLVRQGHHLRAAFTETASYMQDADDLAAAEVWEPHEYSIELSRHFRGLRLWLPLKLHGLAPFRAALEEKMLLARYFYQRVGEIPGMYVGPEPDLSVVTFRYVPAAGDADAFNRRLIQYIQQEGRVFLTSTNLNGRFTLRLAILAYRTHRDTIDEVLEILRRSIGELLATA